MDLQYLQHHQIDKEKWDEAIENAHNGLVYALSWFLDIVSPKWEALVLGDYDAVMPLPIKKKFGFKYVFQPIFIQQLGVFSKSEITSDILNEFIKKLRLHFKLFNVHLNYTNPKLYEESFYLRNTQLIDISKSYNEIYRGYKKNHKKNLQKVHDSGLIIDTQGTSDNYAYLAKEMFLKKGVHEIKVKDINELKQVMDISIHKELGEFYFGKLNGDICATAFFIKWKNRVIVYTALSEKGRKVGAMFGLIDKYLKENAGRNLLFDFAGSNIPGVRYRNLGFGASNEIYYRVTENNLPFIIKLFKK